MKPLPVRLGIASALVLIMTFLIFASCFLAAYFINKPADWTTLENFILFEKTSNTTFKYIAMAMMLLFGVVYTVFALCAGESAPAERVLVAKAAVTFAVAFAICIGINYFVQLTATRLQIQSGVTEGLAQLTQSYNISAINAVNMLGWTVFYPLSTLFLAFSFGRGNAHNTAKWFCLANTAMMFIGLIGFTVNHFTVLYVTMNLGLGVTTLEFLIASVVAFRQKAGMSDCMTVQ